MIAPGNTLSKMPPTCLHLKKNSIYIVDISIYVHMCVFEFYKLLFPLKTPRNSTPYPFGQVCFCQVAVVLDVPAPVWPCVAKSMLWCVVVLEKNSRPATKHDRCQPTLMGASSGMSNIPNFSFLLIQAALLLLLLSLLLLLKNYIYIYPKAPSLSPQ